MHLCDRCGHEHTKSDKVEPILIYTTNFVSPKGALASEVTDPVDLCKQCYSKLWVHLQASVKQFFVDVPESEGRP